MDNTAKGYAQKIVSELEKISHTLTHAPWKNHKASVSNRNDTTDEHDAHPVGETPPEPHNAAQQSYPPTPKWETWLKRIGIAAGIIYAAITYFLWHDANTNFRIDQRAWLGITRIDAALDPKQPTNILIHVANSGKTPAKNSRSHHLVECVPKGRHPQFAESENNATARSLIAPNSERVLTHVNVCFGEQRLQDVLDNKADLFVYGTIWYEDIFGKTHRTMFCSFYDAGIKQLNGCPNHNDGD